MVLPSSLLTLLRPRTPDQDHHSVRELDHINRLQMTSPSEQRERRQGLGVSIHQPNFRAAGPLDHGNINNIPVPHYDYIGVGNGQVAQPVPHNVGFHDTTFGIVNPYGASYQPTGTMQLGAPFQEHRMGQWGYSDNSAVAQSWQDFQHPVAKVRNAFIVADSFTSEQRQQ